MSEPGENNNNGDGDADSESYMEMEFRFEFDPDPEPLAVPEQIDEADEAEGPIVRAERERKRPTWAVIIISIWIVAFYAAFYFFLVAHRFETFSMGG